MDAKFLRADELGIRLEIVAGLTGATPDPVHTDPREGDVRRTEADVSLARRSIGYEPQVDIDEGLGRVVDWFRSAWAGVASQ